MAELNLNPQDLLKLLKGLPQNVAEGIIAKAQEQATTAKNRLEAQAKLDAQKNAIATALATAIADVKVDFDVKVRGGVVEVHLVGVKAGGGTGAPQASPIRDSGMKSRDLVAAYTPDKLAEFDQLDEAEKTARKLDKTAGGSERGKMRTLALAALKAKQAAQPAA